MMSAERTPIPVKETREAVVKAATLAVVLTAVIFGVRHSPLAVYLDPEHLEAWNALVGAAGMWAKPIFIAVGALVILVGVPRMAVSVAGGMLFGIAMGLATVLAATLLSAMVTFYLGRWLGRHIVERRFGNHYQVIRGVMREHGVAAVVLIRQMPLTALMVNLLCSVSGVRARHYFFGSVIGLLPGSIIFVIFGAGVRRDFYLRAGGASALLILVTVATLLVVNRTQWLTPLRELARRREKG